MLKILQVGFNSTQTKNFRMFKLDLEKAEEPEIKSSIMLDNRKSKRVLDIYFCFTDYAKSMDCVDQSKLWKILQEMGIPTKLPAF